MIDPWDKSNGDNGGDDMFASFSRPPGVENLAEDLRARVKSELHSGERLLWSGPAERLPARILGSDAIRKSARWFCVFLVATVASGTLFWYGSQGRLPWPDFAMGMAAIGIIVGVIFSLTSLLVLVAGVATRLEAQRSLGSTIYALTDRRGLIWESKRIGGAVEIRTIPARSVTGLRRIEFPDGSGDVLFDTPALPYGIAQGFLGIIEVRRVEALAREILAAPPPTASMQEE